MQNSKAAKQDLLDELRKSRRAGQDTEIQLRLQGKDGEADTVAAATKRLSDQIDATIKELMEEWLGRATEATTNMEACTRGVRKAAADIKDKVKVAENVVKAVGFLDDAVAIAKKALTGI